MLVLSNDDIARLLTMQDCMAALEPMYRDYAELPYAALAALRQHHAELA